MPKEPLSDSNPGLDAIVEADISVHIFSVSAALVGVCLTVMDLLRIRISSTFIDDVLTVDAFLFLVSCLLSYGAIRTRSRRKRRRWERVADALFVMALLLMTCITAFIAYEIL